ncbi:MAG: alpha/beta fold hydrolase [Puniceicoccales bacterium]|jgi:2-succinyl-6-hydroxy-2,4-cyclohexadiene-1-carboxylate synthase|nr:alpha/beta fold hydrolase [Puniceicoccales bacterium]
MSFASVATGSAGDAAADGVREVLALHGFGCAPADFAPLRARLPAAWKWRVPEINATWSAPPLPPPEPTAPPPVVIGYSLGGRLALHLAAQSAAGAGATTGGQCPRMALVLISATPGIADAAERARRRENDRRLADEIETADTAAFLEKWWRNPLFAGLAKNLAPAEFAALRERRLRNEPSQLAATLRALGVGEMRPLWDALPALRAPVLCVAGERDGKYCDIARRMAALLPDARAVIIPGAWHCPHLEVPDATAGAILEFVRDAAGAAAAATAVTPPPVVAARRADVRR